MANPEHLESLQQGVKAWNQWREQHRDLWPDLSGADFNGANLCYTTFSEVDLSKTNLSEVLLYNTIFADTDFTDARGIETGVINDLW